MIVYKKVTRDFKEFILTMKVPTSASLISKEDHLQASSVEIIAAEDMDGNKVPHEVFYSMYDWNFVYKVGARIDSDICRTKGIYCFRSKMKAVRFMERVDSSEQRKV